MGNTNGKQEKIGNSPYTRSGVSPPKVANKSGSDAPTHRIYDPMTLELHMADERVRARGLSPAEREWRHKYLQDQNLHPDEPIHVDAVHRQLNPVRMLYRWPMDKLFLHFLEPTFGTVYGTGLRVGIPKVLMGFLFVEFIYYIYKYEDKDWQRTRGLGTFANNEFVERRQEIGQKYPGIFELATSDPAKYDHYHPSFKKRLAMVDVGETQRSW